MDYEKKEQNNIFEYVNLKEIRKLLINYTQLCIMFEILCLHINNLIEVDGEKDERLVRTIS